MKISDSEYLEFYLIEKKPKTNVYGVSSKKHQTLLGTIEWYGNWRCYCFFPFAQTIFNQQCLNDIILFIDNEANKVH